MADRALIIAIESYSAATCGFTARQLPGTLEAATRFREWLEAKWSREQTTGTVLFCSEPQVPGGRGASNADLIQALIDLQAAGRNTTDHLFVYFSGHGFQTRGETLTLADVIVTSDYIDLQRSAHCCWKLSALIQKLRCLGHGHHFYFVDACRNEVSQAVASSIMPTPCDAGVEEPAVYVVQSTVPGAPALVAGPFAQTLRNGLNGAGIAARWQPPVSDSMRVQFDSLMDYLRQQLDRTQPVRPTVEGPIVFNALLNIIKPPPTYELTVTLAPMPPTVNGRLLLAPHLGQVESRPLTGGQVVLPLKPNGYTVAVEVDGWTVQPREYALNLYANDERIFTLTPVSRSITRGSRPASALGSLSGRLRVSVPADSTIDIHHVTLGTDSSFLQSCEAVVPAGTYAVRLRDKAGRVVRRSTISVESRGTTALAPADWAGSLPHRSLAARLPRTGSAVDFSEELGGPVADPDLGVWLAIVGAGRVLGSRGDDRKISPLPLAHFAGELPGASPVYLLAGMETGIQLRVAIHQDDTPRRWLDCVESADMPGLREVVAHPCGGQHFVSIVVGDQPALTVATFASPNRCTLITLIFDEQRQPRIAQYLVPLGHLMPFLDPAVRQKIEERRQMGVGPLQDIQSLAMMHRAFRRRRDLTEELGERVFLDLLYGKWVDPIGASLVTYECIRRNQRGPLKIVAANMGRYFADLPDTAAILALAGTPGPSRGVPLFQDGLRVFQHQVTLPFPMGLLDFASPWTSWRGAVHL